MSYETSPDLDDDTYIPPEPNNYPDAEWETLLRPSKTTRENCYKWVHDDKVRLKFKNYTCSIGTKQVPLLYYCMLKRIEMS